MKLRILEQTPNLLKLQLQPQAMLYWLFSSIFAAGGLLLITAMGKTTNFTCNLVDSDQTCQLVTQTILKSEVQSWNIRDIKEAKLDKTTTDDWGSYPLKILTKDGSFTVDFINADAVQKEAYAKQINAFLQDSQATKFNIREDSRLWAYPLGMVLIACGAICVVYVLINGQIVCTFDKTLGKMFIKRNSWFGDSVIEAKLREILGVDIDAVGVNRSTSYNIVIKLESEEEIYLSAGPMFTADSAEKTFEAIAHFLQLETTV
jgi:hypothetical protein